MTCFGRLLTPVFYLVIRAVTEGLKARRSAPAEPTVLNLQEQLVTTQTLTATRFIAVYKAFASGVRGMK